MKTSELLPSFFRSFGFSCGPGLFRMPRFFRMHARCRIFSLFAVLSLAGIASCRVAGTGGAQAERVRRESSFAWIEKRFETPGKEYGSAPLWVWNTSVSETIIDSMMAAFRENAFGGVFIHPRPGLITEYLSPEWFTLVEHTVEKGRELGLDVWIYDENSYPSGFAGGHVPDRMPSSYDQGQMLHLTNASVLPENAGTYFIVLKKNGEDFEDITSRLETYRGVKGEFYLFGKENYRTSPWYGGFSYVDLLKEGVTEKFINVTMEGYERVAGGEFGKRVPGVFTDEPNIEVQGSGNIRWTPDLFDRFHDRWGYDLRPHLPSLYEETGDWKRVRHNYYQLLLQLFIDRWSKPWHAYAEEKGLEWTGHYWEHGWPNPNHGGDNMAMYAWHQRPGIDMLFNQFDEESPHAQFGNVRAVKELASVANQLGKERTLSETYGGGGWELTFTDMKRLGDWEFVLGVNTMNQHLSFMTIQGARKYDYPQSFSYHSPWWPWYRPLNQYFARLSLALSAGEQVNDILILEPTTSAWMYSAYEQPHPRREEIGREFQSFVTFLEKKQVAYDLGSENIIKDHGQVTEGKFIVGERTYSTVVIPPGMENVDSATFILLREYIAGGGKLLSFEKLQFLDGDEDERLAVLNGKAVNLRKARTAGAASEGKTESPEAGIPRNQNASPGGPSAAAFLPDEVIKAYFSSPFIQFREAGGGKLYHQRRELSDGQLLFLVNSGMTGHSRGTLRIHGEDALFMDLMSGRIYDYPERKDGDFVVLDFDLPPAGSCLLFIGRSRMKQYPRYVPVPVTGTPVKASPVKASRLGPNVLTIDFCDVKVGASLLEDQHVYNAADTVFKFYGFRNGNPWSTSVQFKKKIVERDTFSAGRGFSATYHFSVDEGVDLRELKSVIERPALWKVTLNGKQLRPLEGRWWLDRSFGVFNIGDAVRPGDNELVLEASPMSVHAETEPVYILGDFGLEPADKGFRLIPAVPLETGSWKEQGLPMYGQKAGYSRTFTASAGGRYFVELGKWEGTLAVVNVNGKEAGICMAPPYVLDISPLVREGANQVQVVVVGSLKNTLGPFHNDPAPGLVSPWHFRNVREYPSGSRYQLFDYGLMEDFRIMQW